MKILSIKLANGVPTISTSEGAPTRPVKHVSVSYVGPLNNRFERIVQGSPEYIFIKRYKCPTVAIPTGDLIALAVSVEAQLSWPPAFSQMPESKRIQSGASETLAVVVAPGELPSALQWQSSTDGKTWSDISGQTGTSLSVSSAAQYRCVATNAKGSTTTPSILISIAKPVPTVPDK